MNVEEAMRVVQNDVPVLIQMEDRNAKYGAGEILYKGCAANWEHRGRCGEGLEVKSIKLSTDIFRKENRGLYVVDLPEPVSPDSTSELCFQDLHCITYTNIIACYPEHKKTADAS